MTKIPPKPIIQLGRWVWNTLWHQMMSRLAPPNQEGAYLRPASEFRQWINSAENNPYPPATGRYQLYVGMSCPWAHRTLVVRALKGLDAVIPVFLVYPATEAAIWVLEEASENCQTLPELYQLSQPSYRGRATVPVLWDTQTKTIVNNESSEIIVMLNAQFNSWATNPGLDLYPHHLQTDIDRWHEKIYQTVNNGVYRCGFAQTQAAYELACGELFATLDEIETLLTSSPYLCGEQITLADVRLFTTLFRFDAVYYGLFKCNVRALRDYPQLKSYTKRIYKLPGIANTCDLERVKHDYYTNLFPLNPSGIIPLGPSEKLHSQ